MDIPATGGGAAEHRHLKIVSADPRGGYPRETRAAAEAALDDGERYVDDAAVEEASLEAHNVATRVELAGLIDWIGL